MTETVSGPRREGGGRADSRPTAPQGLRIQRVFTTAGKHPYDQVEWVRRDVVMTNWKDGSVNDRGGYRQ